MKDSDYIIKPAVLAIQDAFIQLKELKQKIDFIVRNNFSEADAQKELYLPLIRELKNLKDAVESGKIAIEVILKRSELVRKVVDRKLIYNLAIANLRIAHKKLKVSCNIIDKLLVKLKITRLGLLRYRFRVKLLSYYKRLNNMLTICSVCIGDSAKIIDIQHIFKKKMLDYVIPRSTIEKGDILLSYKTKKYLRVHIGSYLISLASRTRITHSMIVYSSHHQHIKCITATAKTERLSILDLNISDGEVIFVLRPKISKEEKEKLNRVLDEWYYELMINKGKYKFSELKCWTAVIEGFLYTTVVRLTKRNIILPNPFKRSNALFCSELIDEIFKKTNIFLVPRSEYHSIVGPAELLYSPHLEFVGIVCNEDDKKILSAEKLYI